MQDWMIYFRSLQVAGGRLLHFGLNRKASAAFAPHPPHILHRMILYIIILGGGDLHGGGQLEACKFGVQFKCLGAKPRRRKNLSRSKLGRSFGNVYTYLPPLPSEQCFCGCSSLLVYMQGKPSRWSLESCHSSRTGIVTGESVSTKHFSIHARIRFYFAPWHSLREYLDACMDLSVYGRLQWCPVIMTSSPFPWQKAAPACAWKGEMRASLEHVPVATWVAENMGHLACVCARTHKGRGSLFCSFVISLWVCGKQKVILSFCLRRQSNPKVVACTCVWKRSERRVYACVCACVN